MGPGTRNLVKNKNLNSIIKKDNKNFIKIKKKKKKKKNRKYRYIEYNNDNNKEDENSKHQSKVMYNNSN